MPTSTAASATSPTADMAFDTSLRLWLQQQSQQHQASSSWVLIALMRLLTALANQEAGQTVYLLPVRYIENWLAWARSTSNDKDTRLQQAIRLAAQGLGGLQVPSDYHDPGPMDATPLSVIGHVLLLNPNVQHVTSSSSEDPSKIAIAPQRATSWTHLKDTKDDSDKKKDNTSSLDCVAVPHAFYETLRRVHGVLCDDGISVSFCTPEQDIGCLLLHYPHPSTNSSQQPPRPIEFRRTLVRTTSSTSKNQYDNFSSLSLMDKLVREERDLRGPSACTVEVHPVKVSYTTVTGSSNDNSGRGVVLMSREAPVQDALPALIRAARPTVSLHSVRVWIQTCVKATAKGDGYERLDVERLQTRNADKTLRSLTVAEWVERYPATKNSVTVLLETRRTLNSDWPLAHLELEARLQPGDFVDAQDVTGQWFEAVVRKVEPDTITVHYAGWASRWDATLPRYHPDLSTTTSKASTAACSNKLAPPVPLWSQTLNWRERLVVGDRVEVRDSSSLVHRPKWYKGEVKQVGKPTDKVRELTGGADLEVYGNDKDDQKEPMLLLGRTQQVLVQVDQEKTEKAGILASPGEGDLAAGLNPQPPFLRWVNLYGEEICRTGTHLKRTAPSGPATLRYEYDGNRKPVEIMKGHPMHGSGFMRESLRGSPPAPGSVGLHNLGNSCFLNSTVQCLNHMKPLTQYFLQDKYADDLNKKNPLGSGGNVAVAYASLLKKMWGGEYSTLVPRLLKQTVASFAPQFDNSYQHDSQEFCQFLMDGLHEDLNRVKSKPYVEELEGFGMEDEKAAIESWRKHLLRHDSIIVDHCQGMHRSHITCPQCGRESIKFDVYSSISLPLDTTKNQSTLQLEDCLEKFMEGEQLDEKNAWYCQSCRKHVCALKMIALWTVPDILILQLKRFTFDTCMSSGSMLRSKIGYKVEFPIEGLDLTKHILGPTDPDAPPVYRLFGVSEHSGPTANTGHYTATVRNSIDGQWYRCNDSHVGLTSGEASITGGAYLLFYQRAKGISKWAGMGKLMEQLHIDPYGGLNTDQEGFTKVKAKKKRSKP